MIKRIAIYDLDGTLIDSLHRYRTMIKDGKEVIDLTYWRENEHKAYDDLLLPLHSKYLVDCQDTSCYVILATARIIKEPDIRFIVDKLGIPDYLISRKEGDNISGGLLKVRGLQRFFNLKNFKQAWNNACFFEDNAVYLKTVCDHFKIKGIYIPSKQGH